jgi:16S rRNA processing protein RimM
METLVVGRITAVFGVRGWVKVHAYTEQVETLCSYQPWLIETASGVKPIQIDDWRRHGESLVAHIAGIDDRDIAQTWCGNDILVEKDKLPELKSDDYYWHQLEGLSVVSHFEGEHVRLGTVKSLLETGANDVLVIKGDADSIDREERLIPYVDQFVTSISMADKRIDVIWDPAF